MAKIVVDNFFHMPPGHRVSRNIIVGGYVTNFGRYSPYDLYHPNGISMLYSDLLVENDVVFSSQPFSEVTLCGADILIIPNPDYPMYEGTSPYRIDENDRVALFNFMERGGSVLLLVNSFYPNSDFWEENFDFERINPIFEKLGLTWDMNYMSDDSRVLPSTGNNYTVGYGQGGRVKDAKLPPDAQPLLTFEGNIYGFTKTVGKGKIAVIGDAGLVSNGLYYFPGFENKDFILELIKSLTPEYCSKPRTKFKKHEYGNVSSGPNAYGFTEDLIKSLRKEATYSIDHHYRHLVWENDMGLLDAGEVLKELPFDLEILSEKDHFIIPINLLNVCDGEPTKTIDIEVNVTKKPLTCGTEYFVTGNICLEDLDWKDAGGDERLTAINKLSRVSNVVQAELGVADDGSLLYASVRQGQITYARNERSKRYGYDIVLNSKCEVYSPYAE